MRNICLIALFLLATLGGCVSTYTPPSSDVCADISDDVEQSICESRVAEYASRGRAGSASVGMAALGVAWLPFLWYGLYYVTGFVFARFVYVDAKGREWLAFRIKPLWWGAVCVFDPAVGALLYWVLHYSRLARRGIA